jgi:hypothetical protein
MDSIRFGGQASHLPPSGMQLRKLSRFLSSKFVGLGIPGKAMGEQRFLKKVFTFQFYFY